MVKTTTVRTKHAMIATQTMLLIRQVTTALLTAVWTQIWDLIQSMRHLTIRSMRTTHRSSSTTTSTALVATRISRRLRHSNARPR